MLGRIERVPLTSRCLQDNPLRDPHERDVFVYLPPTYDGTTRFPVVLLLAAYGATNHSLLAYDPWKPNVVQRFDRLIAEKNTDPALLVLPDCMTRFGGSQYVDSYRMGAYQTYLADEVIPEVDRLFETIPTREGRAVAGRSSGGFGALRLALDRPDVVSAVASHAADAAFEISLRPMLVTAALTLEQSGGLAPFLERVTSRGPSTSADHEALFVVTVAAAYAPSELDRTELPLPFDPRTAAIREEVWKSWVRHDPLSRIAQSPTTAAATALYFVDAGSRDEHGLHFAARALAEALRMTGANVIHEEFEGGHRGTGFRYENSLPLLVKALDKG